MRAIILYGVDWCCLEVYTQNFIKVLDIVVERLYIGIPTIECGASSFVVFGVKFSNILIQKSISIMVAFIIKEMYYLVLNTVEYLLVYM